ncbi:Sulfate transporter family domain containing protein [Amanita muscaria]
MFYDGQPTRGASRVSSSVGERRFARLRRLGANPVYFYVTNKVRNVKETLAKTLSVQSPRDTAITAVRAIPAVLLGCLLNVLDAVSYGMIIFPSTGVFSGLGPMGVSMFFLTTIISQLVYSGGSSFAGANGSMMIEVVPFFHIMANSIADQIGEKNEREILATTLVAYAFSSILTGLAFLLLGVLKLGVIVGFFPRHILVGCIGGVGVFLIVTGFTVSLRLDDGSFSEAPGETIRYMFKDMHSISLWLVPLTLAVLLRVITSRWHHQLIFPIYFIIIPLVFYIVVLAARLDLGDLRRAGWLFDVGVGSEVAWYQFYSYLDFGKVYSAPLWKTLPTQFALLFFNILHPPLNVPALSVSLNEDVDTNKELVAHGFSNLFAGLAGTVPNYLVYINTLLFYRVGGNNRIGGFMLALATFGLLIMGTQPIAYLPVMVVGALIFVLGIDLVKEALWDTRHRTSTTEYLTILSIMVTMTVWDFVVGVLLGIVVCCFFFVVQSSQRKSIRVIQTGDTAMSSVRRPSLQREYIREVSKQTTIIKLQGFLFFGTIAQVEEAIRDLIEAPSWKHNPIRYLVVDLSLVPGVDMSSAECFVRFQRLLYDKGISLVFCGIEAESPVGKALRSVDLLKAQGVELFSTLNDAMEWTENEYLRTWYNSQKPTATVYTIPNNKLHDTEISSLARTPRNIQLRDAATKTLAYEAEHNKHDFFEEPFVTLSKIFSTFGDLSYSELYPLKSYLERLVLAPGHSLWRQGEPPDGLYIVESGVLRATYDFAERTQNMEETMFPGTLAGELSGLSETPRNATVVVERQAVLWKLSSENLRRLKKEEPGLAAAFTDLVLKTAKVDYDILLGALASRQ